MLLSRLRTIFGHVLAGFLSTAIFAMTPVGVAMAAPAPQLFPQVNAVQMAKLLQTLPKPDVGAQAQAQAATRERTTSSTAANLAMIARMNAFAELERAR